jgi:hypothetical protein
MLWGLILLAVGLVGLGVTFALVRRSVRGLETLKENLR